MIFFNIPIIFSVRVWHNLNFLNSEERSHFLGKLRQAIQGNICGEKIKKIQQNEQKTLLIISYNVEYKIIATVVQSKEFQKAVKIIDFVYAQDLAKIYELQKTVDFKIENIEDLEHTLEVEDREKEHIWSRELFKIESEYFEIKEDDFWLYLINPQSEKVTDLMLYCDQYEIIKKQENLPLILTGISSSGKTTIALYTALNHLNFNRKNLNYQILYVTYNKSSKKSVVNIINKIYNDNSDNLGCNDYQSLCKEIGQKFEIFSQNQFLSQRQVTLYKFTENFCKIKQIKTIEPISLWQEIRHLIKGLSKSSTENNGIISLDDYLELKNQSTLSPATNYLDIYNLAKEYQTWLKTHNYWDELDITNYLLAKIPASYKGEYNEIYCDEIHELTEIQVQLILRLLKVDASDNYLPKFFLTGDSSPIISSNNVSWYNIKKVIWKLYKKLPRWQEIRKFIEPKQLTKSFHSSSIIIDLSSEILTLASETLNLNNQQFIQSSLVKSEIKPLIISGLEKEMFEAKNTLGINSAIIVTNQIEKEKLLNHFSEDKERIITIEEIKDLEFDEVLVWKFFADFENSEIKELNIFKYHCLFTCITRARNKLYFYDDQVNEIWNFPKINNLIKLGNWTELDSFFYSDNSQEEILETAQKYFNQGGEKAYQIAMKLYQKANDKVGARKVEAIREEELGNWGKAGDIWNELFIFEEAIRCWNEVDKNLWEAKWTSLPEDSWTKRGFYFEEQKDYNLANFCYQKAENLEGQLRCLEVTNQWELAGNKCQEKNEVQKADKYYELANQYYQKNRQFNEAIRMWTKLGKWDKAALIFQDLQQWGKAANFWLKNAQIESAALCWEKAKNWSAAQKCWLKLNRWQEVALCYEYQQNWQSAVEIWLKIPQKEKAALCYQKSNEWEKAEKLWRDLGYWGYVAIALQQQDKWQEAGEAWQKTNIIQLEALCYEQAQQWEKAEQCWVQLKNWSKIVIACEKQGKWEEAAESWENLGEWQKSALAWQKIGETEKAAQCYEQGEYWQDAEQCWRKLQKANLVAQSCEKQEKWQEAAEIWQNLGEWKLAALAWQKINETEKAAECYEQGEYWQDAEQCWRKLNNWEKVENACAKQGTWQKAAYTWLQSNQIDQAALCYEKCEDWANAEKYWRELNNWEKVVNACEKQKKWAETAEACLKIDQTEKAAQCYEKCQEWAKAEDCWRKLWKWERIAFVCEYQGKWEEAAFAWLQMDENEKEAQCYEKCQEWAKAEDCWRKLNNWEQIGVVCEYQGKWEEAAQIWQFLNEWEKAALACLEIDELEAAAKYYEKCQEWAKAEACRRQIKF